MLGDIERVLIPHDQIHQRLAIMARQMTEDHFATSAPGTELTIVPILTGAMIFCADLIRQLPIMMRINLITVSSYPGASIRSQGAQVLANHLGDIRGRNVLLVDDILDSGGTIRRVVPELAQLGPASIKTCVLLRKQRAGVEHPPVDYVGFDIPDEFVVGYGLDYNNYYRNLPEIVTLRPGVLSQMMAARESS